MITVYLKPSNYCTVDCTHCYLSTEDRATRNIIDDKTLFDALIPAQKQAKITNQPIQLIWHGGEPLTLPDTSIDQTIDFYHHSNTIFNKVFEGIEYQQYIQTSLIHYSSKFAPLIKTQHGGFISTSYDKFRHIKGSKSRYTDLWESKITQAKNDGLALGITLVPDASMADYDECLKTALYLKNLGFETVHIDRGIGSEPSIPNNHQHSTILKHLFSIQLEYDIEFSAVSAGINLIHNLQKNIFSPSDRWLPACTKSFFTIEPTGNTHACPDIAASDSWSLEADTINRTRWIRKQVLKPNNSLCQSCTFLPACQGGCPITPIFDDSNECAGYKSFLIMLHEHYYPGSLPPSLDIETQS